MSSAVRQRVNTTAARWRRASFWLAVAGLIALAAADLDITRSSPVANYCAWARAFWYRIFLHR